MRRPPKEPVIVYLAPATLELARKNAEITGAPLSETFRRYIEVGVAQETAACEAY